MKLSHTVARVVEVVYISTIGEPLRSIIIALLAPYLSSTQMRGKGEHSGKKYYFLHKVFAKINLK